MGIFTTFGNWLASFRRTEGIELPEAGRSSDENLGSRMNSLMAHYTTISPIVNFEMLKTLKYLWIFNPDISQFVANIQNLANTGHIIQVAAPSEAAAEAAVNRLNETASRIYRNGAGVDGLMNAYLAQISWSGGLSSEDVVNFAGRRVEQTVIVPIEQIRFKYNQELGQYDPYQRTNNIGRGVGRDALGLIPLHPETYRYYALQTIENSPYAKPIASAAIETITESQKPLMENIRYMAQKFGLFGLVTASVAPPPKRAGESDSEHQTRSKNYLALVAKSLEANFRNGLLVTFRDQKLEHTSVAAGASDVYDVNRISEEQVMSGLNMPPVFFGRTDSSTETYADVVYSLMLAQVHNIQRLVKRRQEQTYRLDLRLGGLPVEGVSLNFNRTFSRNAKAENEAEEIKWRTVIAKVQRGVISPDEGAQELGYESWFDAEMMEDAPSDIAQLMRSTRLTEAAMVQKFSFRFSKNAQKYEFVRPQIHLLSSAEEDADESNVRPFIKKKAQQA